MASEFIATFLRDVSDLLESMKSGTLDGLDEGGMLEIARALHSLKSGASFLGWDDLEREAHDLEDVLASSSGIHLDWVAQAERLEGIVEKRAREIPREIRDRGETGRAVKFSPLECRILEESRQRNEHFYRLTCRVDPSEPLPYPRAYLLSSKLETGMTLVKSEPPMDNPEGDFSRPTFWFTTESPESEIFMAANIDLVEVVELTRIEYQDVLESGVVPVATDQADDSKEDTTLVVDRTRYTETMQIAEELAWRLEGRPGTPEANLSAELQSSLESLAFRPLEPLLTDINSAVYRLAERQGLKARFEWQVSSGGLDAATLESLGEILKQLVRNSLRHGIETPEKRLASGKNETGVMKLQVERSGTSYKFNFKDDGRGIDEDAVRERAGKLGLLSGKGDPALLDILCAPGFSMSDSADMDGGRGIGLEMVKHMLKSEFSSSLELENRSGEGLSVKWTLPEKHMRRPYLVFVTDGRTWAIPADSIRRRGTMDPSRVNASGQAYSIGGGLIPMVGPMGLRPPGTLNRYFLEVHHRGRRAALLVDDLVSEEPWGPEEMVPADPAGPWCRSLKDKKDGIPILSPAVVYAAESTGV